MSDVPDVSADRVERLKKEAKRWLKLLRANDAMARGRFDAALPHAATEPTLRDVQLALARERGFDGWASLVAALTPIASPATAELERMARDLLTAYSTGEPAAMERHWRDAGHRRTWDAMRRYIQLDLGKRPARDDDPVAITIDDARRLVAREHGFESWDALVEQLESDSPSVRRTTKPITLARGDASVRTRDVDALRALIREHAIDMIDFHGQATDELLDAVTAEPTVTSLRLANSQALTDEGLQRLARLPNLRELDLNGCAVSDTGLRVLANLPALETVSLVWTRVTDAGVAHLANAGALTSVDLAQTATGDGALRTLRGKPSLRHFRSGAFVTDAGLPALHDFPVFKEWRDVGEVRMHLLEYNPGPNSLLLRGRITDRGLAQLVGLDGLFGLNVDDSALGLSGAALEPLGKLPHLGHLAFDAKNDAMPFIARLPHLRFLGCQDTPADDDGFVALSRSRTLERIWGRRCHNLGDRGFRALSTMPALRGLSVSCLNVSDAALASLPHFPALRELMPMDVPDASYVHIGHCGELESLILMYCRETGDEATEHITSLEKLTRYFNSYTRITDRTPELLRGVRSLERIELNACPGVTNAGIAHLADLPRLQELSLSGMQGVTRAFIPLFPPRVRVAYSPG